MVVKKRFETKEILILENRLKILKGKSLIDLIMLLAADFGNPYHLSL